METVQIIKATIVSYILRSDNIIEIVDNEDWNEADTLDIVKRDTEKLKKLIDNKQDKALYIEVADKHTSKDILDFYQNIELGEVARALVLNSYGAKIMGNLYFKLFGGKPNEMGRSVPIKLFTKKEAGIKWLLEQLEENKK
ncbi:MAG: Unknown protein [uncultured Aureispira sp.]|uniref:STAS/SEC14 domain-containing protein n=1 Tax=uncultured Aureispira sp. TaxID=1331704 RepID=A0A6S6SIE2_9BACT|nr:MAG: Unknown protein [uncultured Aureispira sp.]